MKPDERGGPDSRIGAYARERLLRLLRKLEVEVKRTAEATDADAIHDVRVAIRRFREGLDVFSSLLPGAKQIRRRLKKLTVLASEVRDRDIALELMKQAGSAGRSAHFRQVAAERAEALRALRTALRRWQRRQRLAEWRRELRRRVT